MSKQGLNIAPSPRKPRAAESIKSKPPVKPKANKPVAAKIQQTGRAVSFKNISGEEKVQFNKCVTRNTADGFEMLAIKTRKKVPELLAEALELLEGKYGKS